MDFCEKSGRERRKNYSKKIVTSLSRVMTKLKINNFYEFLNKKYATGILGSRQYSKSLNTLNEYPGFNDDSPYLGIILYPLRGLQVGYQVDLLLLHQAFYQ